MFDHGNSEFPKLAGKGAELKCLTKPLLHVFEKAHGRKFTSAPTNSPPPQVFFRFGGFDGSTCRCVRPASGCNCSVQE
eukprot:14901309-Alexandrium_andersonii.AAC.1